MAEIVSGQIWCTGRTLSGKTHVFMGRHCVLLYEDTAPLHIDLTKAITYVGEVIKVGRVDWAGDARTIRVFKISNVAGSSLPDWEPHVLQWDWSRGAMSLETVIREDPDVIILYDGDITKPRPTIDTLPCWSNTHGWWSAWGRVRQSGPPPDPSDRDRRFMGRYVFDTMMDYEIARVMAQWSEGFLGATKQNHITRVLRSRGYRGESNHNVAHTNRGGLVIPSVVGAHGGTEIVEFDFRAHYPMIILELGDQVPFVIRKLVTELLEKRRSYEASDQPMMAKAFKLLVNSMTGAFGARWSSVYSPGLYNLITRTGRTILMRCKTIVDETPYLDFVCGVTDSITVKVKGRAPRNWKERLVERINEPYTHVRLVVENHFERIVIPRTNNYAAIVLDSVGENGGSGDFRRFTRKIQVRGICAGHDRWNAERQLSVLWLENPSIETVARIMQEAHLMVLEVVKMIE